PAKGRDVTRHIGIVGVSPEGASLFLRQLSRVASEVLEPHLHPRLTLHNEPLAFYIDAVRQGDWHEVGRLLARSAEKVAEAGASFCVTPDHAIHQAVHLAESQSPIPWLVMTECVAEHLRDKGVKKVGIVGTKLVTSGSAYQSHLGLKGVQVLAPSPEDADRMDRIIFGELIYGRVAPEAISDVRRIVEGFRSLGCEGVILASSEAPLVISGESWPLPLYDASEILAQAAIRQAMTGA
ncbi:MAG: aspartate/glutamate racemase family protein, partial [Phycisphaerales bacterium]|nr:aspartate/glutamate racemase family protein [Phycisphaerales bacterium]